MEVSATYLLQLMLNGLMLGLIYALIAVGLALIFGVLEVINFAHGEFLMLGGYAMALSLPLFGLSYWPALAVAMLATSLVGLILYEFFLRHIGQREFERSILTTLGISMILLYGMQYLFTATPLMVDTAYGFEGIEIGSIRITLTRLIAGGLSIVAFSGLYCLLKF